MYRGLLNLNNAPTLKTHLQEKELYYRAQETLDYIKIDPFSGFDVDILLHLRSLGAKIQLAKVEKGFLTQNIEDKLSLLNFKEGIKKIASLNFKNPFPYQLALVLAIEGLFEKSVNKSIELYRAMELERSRIKHHLEILQRIFSSIESLSCLNLVKILEKNLEIELVKDLKEEFLNCSIAHTYLSKVAVITSHMAASYGLTGPYLRANRIRYDVRGDNKPKVSIADNGDLWARTFLRIEEIIASLEWLLENFSKDESEFDLLDFTFTDLPKKNIAYSLVEGPEGDIKVNLFFDKNKKNFSYRIKTPGYFIAQAIPHFLINKDISEVSLILSSLGIVGTEIDK